MNEYLLKFKSLINSLLAGGYQINDDVITEYVLDGLGGEFRMLLSKLNSKKSFYS